ncbi:MAG: LysR family transcriptional regulator [Xanthobacteraceae bacterium]
MQLNYFRYLVALAKERHFGRAAATLHISQSALSQAIRQLEKHFSVSIVQRHQSGFQGFTREGEAILSLARQFIADHDRLLNTTWDDPDAQLSGTLRIALSPVAMTITSLLTAPFAEKYPGVKISVLCKTMPEIERGLKEFEYDIGVTYLDGLTLGGLRPYALYEEAYYLLVPKDHSLSSRKTIDWEEVGNQPLCLLSPNLHNRIIIDRILGSVGVTPQAVIETNCSLGLFAHMRTGNWLTVVPHSYFYLLGDWMFIRSIPIVNPSQTATIGLVIHERDPISPVVRAFVSIAQQAGIAGQLDRYRI